MIEAAIIAKYGGWHLGDPDIDQLPVLLRINNERASIIPESGVKTVAIVYMGWVQAR
jgi:hypothetical protein